MSRFHNTLQVAVDAKGRLIMPIENREVLARSENAEMKNRFHLILHGGEGDQTVLSYASCVGFSMYEKMGEDLDFCDSRRAQKLENFFAAIEAVKFDAQGRMSFSANVMEHLGLKENATFIGRGRYFEVWSPDTLKLVSLDGQNTHRETIRTTIQSIADAKDIRLAKQKALIGKIASKGGEHDLD